MSGGCGEESARLPPGFIHDTKKQGTHGALYALVAAAAFGFASVAVYFIDNVVDAERDRRHPRKRFRPVAAGDLPKSHAVAVSVLRHQALSAGLVVSVPLLTAAVSAYLGFSFLYSFVLSASRWSS